MHYESNSLKRVFENERKLQQKCGKERADLVKRRLYELHAAACLDELRYLPGPRLHQHSRNKGQKKAVFSVDLDHPYRLLFEAGHDPEPELPGGGADWTRVTRIIITGIEDPHG
ncbi:MAG TPA: type II toxin-antitoxin system RelE/ParE family toxin [Candidatus Hydrogenedentes bacterium]|nr:type II toxin-antitoxin system RelE/ParE family toxin [Candidatus Hydrogenedentota bacterium]